MKRILAIPALLVSAIAANAQEESKPTLGWNAYAEAYYSYDFNKPADNNRPGFFYSQNRHNEFNLNLGYIKASLSAARVRANLALAAGTYVNANYAAEPGVLKNVFEANAGVRVSKNKNLWLDAGIFGSHIGFESALSKDCWTLTRSLLAENSPYYEAGAKLSYTSDNGKWLLSALALNGWQRIKRMDGNSMMSWGTQIQYKPSANAVINYSTFIGTDKPDSIRAVRVFHNLYGIFNLTEKLGLALGFDIGTEENAAGGTSTWFSPAGIVKYSFNNHWALAARGEFYSDKDGVLIGTGTPNGFQTAGYSMNLDYAASQNVLLRLEGRLLRSKDEIFTKGDRMTSNNAFVTGSIAVSF